MATDPNSMQVGGAHYQSPYQTWDFIQRGLAGRYLEGCAAKYLSRWRKKDGLPDLKKAQHYLEKMLFIHREDDYPSILSTYMNDEESEAAAYESLEYCAQNGITGDEAAVICGLSIWDGEQDLQKLLTIVHLIIAREEQGPFKRNQA